MNKYVQGMVNQIRPAMQFFKFAIVGLSNTTISLVVYYSLLYFHVHYQLCNVVAFVVSVYNGYFWSSRWVFKQGKKASSALRFYLSYAMTFLLSVALMHIFVETFHLSDKLAPILTILVTIPLNFILNKFWTFRH